MKKLIIAVAVLSFGLTSCQEKCKTCTTITTVDGVTQDAMTISQELCGDALDSADGQVVTTANMVTTTTCE